LNVAYESRRKRTNKVRVMMPHPNHRTVTG